MEDIAEAETNLGCGSKRYKLVIVGDGACGKTSILTVFKTGEFLGDHVPTVFEVSVETITLEDKTIELALWDTAGQEAYDRLRPLSYRGTDVILICYSIESPDSLANVETQWAKEVKHFCKGVPIILVGNKLDLRTDSKTIQQLQLAHTEPVSTEKMKKVASQIGAHAALECSAKTQENIQKVFEIAAKAALDHKKSANSKLTCTLL